MKINRLLEMITLLLNHRRITASNFAERFNVSTRTVYRDVEDLSLAGIPIYMSKGKGGGISLIEDFTLSRTMITRKESESLLVAVQALQATHYPEISQFLEKLESLFRFSASNRWIEIDFSPWGTSPLEEEKFNHLRHAILNRNAVQFDYINFTGERFKRMIYPIQMIFKSNVWYLRGFCLTRDDYRTFRLSRIKSVVVLPAVFNPKILPEEKSEDKSKKNSRSIHVRLRFSTEAANRIYDDFNDNLVHLEPDGSFQVVIDVIEDEWIRSLILSYGCLVEVLEPIHLRSLIVKRLRTALDMYKDSV